MNNIKDTELWDKEGDNYTMRAMKYHNNDMDSLFNKKLEMSERDNIEMSNIIKKYSTKTDKILDIGCSYGATIKILSRFYPNSSFVGIDTGAETINLANKNVGSSKIKFYVGHSHNLGFIQDKFDVIILSMVLQWIPRSVLIKTISEIDRLLNEGGIVYIWEFLPDKNITSQSKHNGNIRIFKQDYSKCFTSFVWFKEVFRKEIIDSEEKKVMSIIKKYPLNEVYSNHIL